jgi:hypothetical protein
VVRDLDNTHMKLCTLLIVFRGRGTPDPKAPEFVSSEATGTLIAAGDAHAEPEMRLTADVGRTLMDTRVFNHDGRFFEAGRISFPNIDSHLDVDTPDPGRAYPRPDGSSYGAATWRILGGGGRFAGAHGLVTGNFTADADGNFVDHQLYKIFLPA